MFIVEAKHGKINCVTGIFLTRELATAYIEKVPERLRGNQSIKEIAHITSFPFFIVEWDERTPRFEYVDEDGLRKIVDAIERDPERDAHERRKHIYANVYIIEGEWYPPSHYFGRDYMGWLRHIHIDAERIEHFLEEFGSAGEGLVQWLTLC